MKKPRNTKEFVVGYEGKAQDAVYAENVWAFGKDSCANGEGGLTKMTLPQAKKHLKSLMSDDCNVVVFKLVPFYKEKRKK